MILSCHTDATDASFPDEVCPDGLSVLDDSFWECAGVVTSSAIAMANNTFSGVVSMFFLQYQLAATVAFQWESHC